MVYDGAVTVVARFRAGLRRGNAGILRRGDDRLHTNLCSSARYNHTVTTSLFDLYKIGVGPSSSHTMGPMRAACRFARGLADRGVLEHVERVQVELLRLACIDRARPRD